MSILEVRGISSGYRDKQILHKVSFSVNKGEFIGIIGPNGAGKTTLLRTLTHIIRPSAGEVLFDARDLHKLAHPEVARDVAMVGQGLVSIFSFTVREIVLMGRSPYIGILRHEKRQDLDIVDEALEITELSDLRERPIDELSSGEMQRVLIAKALAQTPRLLLLDEPTAHLDIGHQTEILDLVISLREKKDLTVICVLHDLNLASQYCDRILLLSRGMVVDYDSPKQILKYDTIEKVFNAVVLVNDKTFPDRPLVVPIRGDLKQRSDGSPRK